MTKLRLTPPIRFSSVPDIDRTAMNWAQLLIDQVQKWGNGGLGTDNIADGSITSAKIADGTITNNDLSGGNPQLNYAYQTCTADLTLTTSYQDLTGASVSLVAGTWMVLAVFDFNHTAAGGGLALGGLNVNGSLRSNVAILNEAALRATVFQQYLVSLGSTVTVKLQAEKTAGFGTVIAQSTHSAIFAIRIQ